MTTINREQLRTQLHTIEKRLSTLEWDKRHNQLHGGLIAQIEHLRAEQTRLEEEIRTSG